MDHPFLNTVMALTISQMRARYRKTFAGVIWVMLNPILIFLVHALVFKFILKIEVGNFLVFLVSGLLPWVYITQTINMTANTFVSQRELLLAFQVHPIALVLSIVIDNFFNFIVPLFVLIFFLFFTVDINLLSIALLPLPIIAFLIGTLAISSFFSTLQVFFRDTQFILQFITSLMYLLTPIFYPVSFIPEDFRWMVNFNPFYILIEPFQIALWNFELQSFFVSLGRSFMFSFAMVFISVGFWRKKNDQFYLYI